MAEGPDSPEMIGGTTCGTVLGGRVRLRQPARGHRAGHDAVLLAAFAPPAGRAADLGCGVGTAGLALLARQPQAQAMLVEIDPELAALAADNAQVNGLADRCRVVAGDVLRVARPSGPREPEPGAAELVLMNPPFNPARAHQLSPHGGRALAHVAPAELLREWVTAAYRCLTPAGTLCLIHRPEELAALLAALDGRFGALELLPVHPRADAPAVRLLARATKGRRTAPKILPGLVLADADGRPTAAAEAVLRDAQGLA